MCRCGETERTRNEMPPVSVELLGRPEMLPVCNHSPSRMHPRRRQPRVGGRAQGRALGHSSIQIVTSIYQVGRQLARHEFVISQPHYTSHVHLGPLRNSVEATR